MELNVIGSEPISVAETIFDVPFKQGLVHQVVTSYQAGGRAGTKAQKTRAEVKATTKKSKRQKGGGARHGALSAPIFVGGGITFAAKPRSFEQKINRKMYRGALKSILAELNRQDRLRVVNEFDLPETKSRALLGKLTDLDVTGRVVLIDTEVSEKLHLASRNIKYLMAIDVNGINPVDLVAADYVVVSAAGIRKIEEWLA